MKLNTKIEFKNIAYALIVVFLLFTMYYLGQLSTFNIMQQVEKTCNNSGWTIQGASPFGVQLIYGDPSGNSAFNSSNFIPLNPP